MSVSTLSRRTFLSAGTAAAFTLACRRVAGAPQVCRVTDANIEGPYYRAGAGFRSDLTDPGMGGEALDVSGRVLSADCRTPLAGAVLDVWQADSAGHYDNDGSFREDRLRLRGKVRTDGAGKFSFRTLVPGRYLNGPTYRPAHIHVKLAAPGHRLLTTQLYFPGDPYNAGDPFFLRSLLMDVSSGARGKEGHFDFVATPV